MKKILSFILILSFLFLMPACQADVQTGHTVVATTKPVYDFTFALCRDTDISVDLLITEKLSCLHDYTLQVRQMRALENADVIVISGAGLENFLSDIIDSADTVLDASENIELLCHEHNVGDDAHDHHHAQDPHIWMSIQNAQKMAQTICNHLTEKFPEQKDTILANMEQLNLQFDALFVYAAESLSSLNCRNIITFHDGFAYFCNEWDITILLSMEEESGSEASALQLTELIEFIRQYDLKAVFTEENGSVSAAEIISSETGVSVYPLTTCMSDSNYFDAMHDNITVLKEALT